MKLQIQEAKTFLKNIRIGFSYIGTGKKVVQVAKGEKQPCSNQTELAFNESLQKKSFTIIIKHDEMGCFLKH